MISLLSCPDLKPKLTAAEEDLREHSGIYRAGYKLMLAKVGGVL